MREALAIIGALVAMFSTVPYLIDIVRGKTKPNIVTWLTWTLLTGISGSAALAGGEKKTALFLLGTTLCTAAVVVLGLKYGIAEFSRFDIVCQISALLGLVLWLVFNSPVIGIVVPLLIDLIGALPTVRHAWLKPGEETWQSFAIGIIAPALTIASLTRFNIISLAFPLYLLLSDLILSAIIIGRRKQFGLPLTRTV